MHQLTHQLKHQPTLQLMHQLTHQPTLQLMLQLTLQLMLLILMMVMMMNILMMMTSVIGKTGVSGLADAFAVKMGAGTLTTSCLICQLAVVCCVQDGRLKLGPANQKIVMQMLLMKMLRVLMKNLMVAMMVRTLMVRTLMVKTLMVRTLKVRTLMGRTLMARTLMVKNLEMATAIGKSGASGLVPAVHSLADALAVKLVRGTLTTSCLTSRAAADSSVQEGKLKEGPVKHQIVNQLQLRHQKHANGEIGVNGEEPAAPYLAGSLAGRHAQGEHPTTCKTDSAAAFSAQDLKLNPGAAEMPTHDFCFKIVSTSFRMCQKIQKKVSKNHM